VLIGEAGIGKSRLVAEVQTEAFARDFQVLQGNCFPEDHSCPYAPLLDLLRSILHTSTTAQAEALLRPFTRELAPLLPDIGHALPNLTVLPPLPALEPEQAKRRLFAALVHFLLSQSTEKPLLLVVEDIHWSDDTSLEFLQYLARCCVSRPLLILLTYRSDEVRPTLSHWLAELDRQHLGHEIALTAPALLYHARGQAYETLGEFELARQDYERALEFAHDAHDDVAEWQSLLDLGFLWTERDYQQTGVYFHRALESARTQDSPRLLAHSLNRLGNWYLNVELPHEALRRCC
jgi:tetratricopeptide (TPR) repeat protein